MQKIDSFKIDHTRLLPGLYVSRRDRKLMTAVTTFDLRFTAPNREPPIDVPALHTIEHLGATFLRNSKRGDDIVYFGPMGCRTGFYLVMFGRLEPQDVYPLIVQMCAFIENYEGEIPGATEKECGNFREQNLELARYYASRYHDALGERRFTYPDPKEDEE